MPPLAQLYGFPEASPQPVSASRLSLTVPPTAAIEDVTPGNTDIPVILLLALDDDRALERFFDAIPDFCSSKLVNVNLPSLCNLGRDRQALNEFLDRTLSSIFVKESVRNHRITTCLNAAYAALGLNAFLQILKDIFDEREREAPGYIETGHSLRCLAHRSDDSINLGIRTIVARIVARSRIRDDRWTTLVKDEFGVPDEIFRDYLAHWDSVLLAILIHVTGEDCRTGRPERGVWNLFLSLTCTTLFPSCGMRSAPYGMKERSVRLSKFSPGFAMLMPLFIKVLTVPQPDSLLSSVMTITFCPGPGHIDCATSRVIAQTRPRVVLLALFLQAILPPGFVIHPMPCLVLLFRAGPLGLHYRA
jgi:hypothetical protein